MSEQPYPEGTRVVLTWSETPAEIGDIGTARHDTLEDGTPVFGSNGEVVRCHGRCQAVLWDSSFEICYAPIWCLRPFSDPDAEARKGRCKDMDTL